MRSLPSLLLAALGGVVAAAPAAPLQPGAPGGIAAPVQSVTAHIAQAVANEQPLADHDPATGTSVSVEACMPRPDWRCVALLLPPSPAFQTDADVRAGLLSLPPPRA